MKPKRPDLDQRRSPNDVRVFNSLHERQWVAAAAGLAGLSMRDYVRRAINRSLRKEGCDAVLLPLDVMREVGD